MKTITLDQFCDLKFISNLTYSPKGTHLCFTASQADKSGNKYTSFIYELCGKRVKQLTSGGKETNFQFLDDDTIIFPANREESKEPSIETKYYTLSLSGGEAVKAFSFPLPVQQLIPLENGDFIVSAAVIPGWEDLYQCDKKRIAEYMKSAKGAGVDIAEVNRFIKQFEQAQKMMKQLPGMMGKRGKLRGMGGFPF